MKEQEYTFINQNREVITVISTFEAELMKILYYALEIQRKEKMNPCELNYYLEDNRAKYIGKEMLIEEKLLHFFMYNTLKALKEKIDKLAELTYKAFIDYHYSAQSKFRASGICILIFIVFLYSCILFCSYKDRQTIRVLVFHFFYQKQKDIFSKEKELNQFLMLLKKSILSYSYENFQSLESFNLSSLKEKPKQTKGKPKTLSKMKKKNKESESPNDDDKNFRIANNTKLLQPYLFRQMLIGYLILFISLLVFQIINIYYIEESYDSLIFQNSISTNVLERIPKVVELILYFYISIIFNHPFYTKVEPKNYQESLLSNYYNITLNLEDESFYSILKNSGYANLYYQIMVDRNNLIDFFDDPNHNGKMELTIKWYYEVNSINDYPIYVTYIYNNYYNDNCNGSSGKGDIFTCISDLTQEVASYVKLGNRMNTKGFNTVLNFKLQELNSIYLDFVDKYENSNIFTNSKYITSDLFWTIVQNTYDIFKATNMIYLIYLEQDIKNAYDNCKATEILLSLLSILLNFGLFIGIAIFISKKLQKYIFLLSSIGKQIYQIIVE